MDSQKTGFRIEYLLMLITAFFWAAGHPLGRIIVQEVHPFQLGTVTLGTGFIGVFIFLAVSGKIGKIKKICLKDILISLGIGVFGFFLYQILTFSALARIPASANAVLVSINVVFIAILAFIILRERITAWRIAGIIIAFSGVMLVTFNTGFSTAGISGKIDMAGVAFSLMAALSFALYSVLGKKVLASNDPLIVSAIALFSGAALLAILTAATVGFEEVAGAELHIKLLMAFLGLTMIGISYPLWFTCLKRLPASHVSIYIYLTPVFAVILSLLILKERFTWLFWMGGALILAGIVITHKASSARNIK